MNCAIVGGYTQDCNKDSLGGLHRIRIAALKDIVSITEVNDVVSAIVMATGKQFFDFQLVKNTSNFSIVPTPNVQAGTNFYAETLAITFNKMKATTSALVDKLAKASLVALVEDRNGEVILLGRNNGLDLSGGTIGSGTAGGDRNGYELSFTGEEAKITHVDPTIVTTLLSPAA